MKIKRQTRCKFMDKCRGCVSEFDCISATGITSPLRRYLLKVCGHRQKANKAMQFGKDKHEELLSKFPTLAEYGYKQFKVDLYKGRVIELSEVSFCSPKHGFLGIIDYFSIQFKKPNTFNILIVDIKPRFNVNYIKQAMVYGTILSDSKCRIAEETITPRSKKRKRISYRMFPDMDYILNIDLKLDYYFQKNPTEIEFMKDSVLSVQAQGIMTSIKKAKYDRIEMHKHGLYYAEYLPQCSYCKQNSEWCSLWEICQKINYEEEVKHKQKYFGKNIENNLLIKTKPKVRR